MEHANTKILTPNTMKRYIPVKNHLPTPIPSPSPSPSPSPTCSGMFDTNNK